MIEHIDKLIAIFFSLLIFAQAYFIRKIVGTWIFPACLFSLAWFFYTFFPLVFLFGVPIEPLSIGYIFLCTLLFSIGSLPFNWPKAFRANSLKTAFDAERLDSVFLHRFLYFASVVAICATLISLISNGVTLNFSLINLLEISGQFAEMRGQGEIYYGNWGRASIVFTYVSALVGGLVYFNAHSSLRKSAILIATFTPSVFVMLTQSAKLTLFLSFGFFFSAILIQKIYNNQLRLLSGNDFIKLLVIALLSLPLLAISFLSRTGLPTEDAGNIINMILTSFSSYLFGHIYAFSDWFSHYVGSESIYTYVDNYYSLGNYTFQSVFELFGNGIEFPAGIYDEYFSHGDLFTSNLYTIFRGLIYDFGGIGSLIYMLGLGILIHAFFYRLLALRKSWVAFAVFVVSFVSFQASFIISLFMARYMYLIFCVLLCLLYINDVVSKRRRHFIQFGG